MTDLSDLKKISDVMDRQFKGPFGWRFGWDGLLGLVPIVGDLVTNAISLYVVLRAAQTGVAPSVILRMGLNILIENLVDMIPFFGNLFDFFWKANSKNMVLVEKYHADPTRVRRNSKLVLAFTVALILATVLATIALSIFVLRALIVWVDPSR
jgi:hypothetical protein